MSAIVAFPVQGAYLRLPATPGNAKIIAFPKPMRANLPPSALAQMARLKRERQIADIVTALCPL